MYINFNEHIIHNLHNTSVMYYLTKAASNLEIDFSLLCIYTTSFIQRYSEYYTKAKVLPPIHSQEETGEPSFF